MKIKTGIVVLYYNKLALTTRCLESILKHYSDDQCFAFDNGSEKNMAEAIKNKFSKTHHYRIESNKGYSGGFNAALKWVFSQGLESVLFLTNDTMIYPNVLESCEKIAKEKHADIIAPCIYYLSKPNEIDSIGGFFDDKNFTLQHYHERDLPIYLEPNKDYVPGTALWLTRNAFESLQGMDESYHTYWEDADFSFRAHKRGIKIARAYSAKIGHEVGKTCHKKPVYTAYYFQRNRVLFCRQHLSKEDFAKAKIKIQAEWKILEKKWLEKNDTKRLNYLKEIEKLWKTA